MPKHPEKFAAKIDTAMQNATPKKREALKRRGLLIPISSKLKVETDKKIVARVKRALNELKRKQTKEGRSRYQLLTRTIAGKYAVEYDIRKALGMYWDYWVRMSDIERNGIDNTSVTLPTKNTMSIKTSKQKSVLTETL